MRTMIICLTVLTFVLPGCKKDGNPDSGSRSCAVSDSVRAGYTESAAQLLMAQYRDDPNGGGYNNPEFSHDAMEEILGYITSVHNLRIPERDTIFNFYGIKAFPQISLYDLSLKVDTAAVEVKRLLAGAPTGNASFDALVARFGLHTIRPAYGYPAMSWIYAKTAAPYNMIAVAKEFASFPFIRISEPAGAVGDGDRIELSFHTGIAGGLITVLDFSHGWGDCPSGCIRRTHWKFYISNCQATYAGRYGD